MKESLVKKSLRILKEEGLLKFLQKGYKRILFQLEPLRIVYYPYAKRRLPKEATAIHTAETASAFALDRLGGFIRPSQVRWEIISLAKIVERLKPKTVLEIGTSKGGTLFIWSRLASKNANIISIDLPGGENTWAYPQWKEPFYRTFASQEQSIHLLREDSHSERTLAEVKGLLHGEQIDFIFIDGDHAYEGVKKDYELYAPLVRAGGVIAFHDIAQHPPITGCHVDQFWNEIKSKKQYKELIEKADQGWAGIGVLFN